MMRADAGGPHASMKMDEWKSARDIDFDLIPKSAHHERGPMERNDAARREQ